MSNTFSVRPATLADAPAVARLAARLWGTDREKELFEEFQILLSREGCAVFLCDAGDEDVGFAQCQLRHDYVEGTESSPVGYLEGLYVSPGFRRRGLGRELVNACRAWAKAQGCTEFASDCQLGNEESLAFHLGAGFQEAGRIICFVSPL